MFINWLNNLNEKYEGRKDICHIKGDLLSMDSGTFNYSLGSFIIEVRMGNGSEYRSNTLYEIIEAIQYYLHENGKFVTFMDDSEFGWIRRM